VYQEFAGGVTYRHDESRHGGHFVEFKAIERGGFAQVFGDE
jgi:hypothetical protein